jgi:hypothetical protein
MWLLSRNIMAFNYPTPEEVKSTNPGILRQAAIDRAVQVAADEEANRLGDEIRAAMGQNAPPWKFLGEYLFVGDDKDGIKYRARLEAMKRHQKELTRAGYCAKVEFNDVADSFVLIVNLRQG